MVKIPTKQHKNRKKYANYIMSLGGEKSKKKKEKEINEKTTFN